MPIDACRAILAVMPELIREPSRVTAAGEPPKLIDEYVGQASTRQAGLSIAHMHSLAGWAEPGQRPEFDEFTIVLRGALVVESERGVGRSSPGQPSRLHPGPGPVTLARMPARGSPTIFTRCRQPPEDRLPPATHWPASHPVTPRPGPG